MNKTEYKQNFYELMDTPVDGFTMLDKIELIRKLLVDYQKDHQDELDTSNKGKPWSDEQLEIILSAAPTRENCAWFARLFKRGYGSIEQIYRWAATDAKSIEGKGRDNDAFVQQVKKIAKKVGSRA